jgi:hypothetical protein
VKQGACQAIFDPMLRKDPHCLGEIAHLSNLFDELKDIGHPQRGTLLALYCWEKTERRVGDESFIGN